MIGLIYCILSFSAKTEMEDKKNNKTKQTHRDKKLCLKFSSHWVYWLAFFQIRFYFPTNISIILVINIQKTNLTSILAPINSLYLKHFIPYFIKNNSFWCLLSSLPQLLSQYFNYIIVSQQVKQTWYSTDM